MPKMTYTGKKRTVRSGPRVYRLKQGTFDVHPHDVRLLTELGATPKDDGGTSADTGTAQEA